MINFLSEERSHNNGARVGKRGGDALVRHHHGSIDVEFVLELDIFSSDSKAVDADPLTYSVLPTDDAAFDQTVAVNLSAFHHSGIVDFLTRSDNYVGTDDDVGAELCCRVDLGRRIH